ncbi:MAG TPA: phosphotransferase [Armatimonadota bacterium]
MPHIAFVLIVTFGGDLRFDKLEPLGGSDRSYVARCRILDPPKGVPASVVIKAVKGDWDPLLMRADTPTSSHPRGFANDWFGAQFLTEVRPGLRVSPKFVGGLRSEGFIVLEDLGEGDSLAEVLQGNDPARADRALMAYASTLGRMHAATIGHEGQYNRLRDDWVPGLSQELPTGDASYTGIREACRTLGVPLSPEAEAGLDRVALSMKEPGPFLAYTHGDPCPDNNRLLGDEVRLIDFECGAYRHALCDGVYGRLPFPTCWCVNRLPAQVPPHMEAAYRAELVKGCPEAGDDDLFRLAVVEATAHWTCETTGSHLPGALEGDHEWGISTIRQRVLLRLDNLAVLTEELGLLEPLGDVALAMAKRLRALWPADLVEMPLYPAFR